MKFYDLHIESIESGVADVARFAELLGFSTIAICNPFINSEKLKLLENEIRNTQSDVELLLGVKIEPKNANELSDLVNRVRNSVHVVIVAGGDYAVNRAACENSKVDILAHPELNRLDNGLDEACLNAAVANNVAIQVNFREILYAYRKPRSHVLNKIATNIRLATALHAPLTVCSCARSHWDMRDARELVSIANIFGVELGTAFACVTSIPQNIVENNKKILSGASPNKGVEVE